MPTEAEVRRRKKQDATRERVALWLSPDEAWGLPSRIATLRRLFLYSRRAIRKKTARKPR